MFPPAKDLLGTSEVATSEVLKRTFLVRRGMSVVRLQADGITPSRLSMISTQVLGERVFQFSFKGSQTRVVIL